MENRFNNKTKKLEPYLVSDRTFLTEDDWIVLDWNESTMPIEDSVKNDLINFIVNGNINQYGDVNCELLLSVLAEFNNIDKKFITVFNGSDSALNICFECILNHDDKVLTISPDYSQVNTFIQMKGGLNIPYNLKSIQKPDIVSLNSAILGSKVFYLSNPNNPIGFCFSFTEIEYLVKNNPLTMFFLDEAYYEFRGDTVISLVKKYDNIIIFRTFSKAFGLAGLRLGYIISNFENINLINKVRNGKEVSSLAQIAGVAAILNYSHYLNRVKDLIDVREWFYNEIKILDNYQVFESSSNFLLVKHSESKQIIKHLYKNKILVRDRSSMHLLNNCFRITIGSKQEMAKVLEILKLY